MNVVPPFACNIVILPANDLAQKSREASQLLQSPDTLFTLGTQANIPHVSLYMVQLKRSDIDRVKALLAGIAKDTTIQKLTATKYVQEVGYLGVNYERPDDVLVTLQNKVLQAINPVRDGMRPKDAARLETASGVARNNLETYGYRGIGELFLPHITFTRVVDDASIGLSGLPAPQSFTGKFVKLALCEMGDNGTCARIIAEFELTA